MTKDELKIVNKTYRQTGAVGKNPIVYQVVCHTLERSKTQLNVLDYGSGKYLTHISNLKSKYPQHRYDGYDVGDNTTIDHVTSLVEDTYDVVLLSNVLNVQPSITLFWKVIAEVNKTVKPGGIVMFNMPRSPVKWTLKNGKVPNIGDVINLLKLKYNGHFGEFAKKNAAMWLTVDT